MDVILTWFTANIVLTDEDKMLTWTEVTLWMKMFCLHEFHVE